MEGLLLATGLCETGREPPPTECAYCGQASSEEEDITLFDCEKCLSRSYCGELCRDMDWQTHNLDCNRPNYILRVALCPKVLVSPQVTRTLSCPGTATLASLHAAVMVAFGWTDTAPIRDFTVAFHQYPLKYERGFPTITLRTLYASRTRLHEIVEDKNFTANPAASHEFLSYTYICGSEHWEHSVSYIGQTAGTAQFSCTNGEGHGCAEGVGGPQGWRDLLMAYDANKPNFKQTQKMIWFQECAGNNRNPQGLRGQLKWNWDIVRVDKLLSELNVHSHTLDRSLPRSCVTKPSVLLISLNRDRLFDDKYERVISALRTSAIVREVTSIPSAVYHLSHKYQVVIVTDPSVFKPDFIQFSEILEKYAYYNLPKVAVIFGFQCGNIVDDDLQRLEWTFKHVWNIKWKAGKEGVWKWRSNDGHLSQHILRLNPHLKRHYALYEVLRGVKVRNLKGANSGDRIYVSERSCPLESPAILAKHYNGFVGWLGIPQLEGDDLLELLFKMCAI